MRTQEIVACGYQNIIKEALDNKEIRAADSVKEIGETLKTSK